MSIALKGMFFMAACSKDDITALGLTRVEGLTAEQPRTILFYRVVSGNVRSGDLSEGSVETLNGPIEISLMLSPSVNVTTMIVETDIQATNDVVHVIDKVLLPAAR